MWLATTSGGCLGLDQDRSREGSASGGSLRTRSDRRGRGSSGAAASGAVVDGPSPCGRPARRGACAAVPVEDGVPVACAPAWCSRDFDGPVLLVPVAGPGPVGGSRGGVAGSGPGAGGPAFDDGGGDRPSVQTTESGGPRGADGGNQIQGRQRHAGIDPLGLPWVLPVHPALVQDREGAPAILAELRTTLPSLQKVWADGGTAVPNGPGPGPRCRTLRTSRSWHNPRNRRVSRGFRDAGSSSGGSASWAAADVGRRTTNDGWRARGQDCNGP